MTLPLPLVPFEEYMLLDDRPSHPMSFLFRLRFSGRLDRGRVESALARTLRRHPLLTALVRRRGRRWQWVQAGPPAPVWQGAAALWRIDLSREPGLRCRILEDRGATLLELQFHHACCDGAGAAAVVCDLLTCYAAGSDEEAERQLPPLDPTLLPGRGDLANGRWALARAIPRQLIGLQGVIQFAFRNPRPVAAADARQPTDDLPDDYPSSLVREFDGGETGAIRAAARQLGVSLNDLILRDVFLSLHQWRAESGIGSPRDWLRISVPMSLRTPDAAGLPAANRVSMIFLDRRAGAHPQQLLDSIRDEMNLIRRLRLDLTFLMSLGLLRRIPGGLRRAVRPDRCAASCIVSNLGDLLASSPLPRRDGKIEVGGGLTLDAVEVGAPNRPNQDVAFLLSFYAGRLSIGLQYDSRAVTARQAGEIMDLLGSKLAASAAIPGSAGPSQ